jgi:hypothetical protein
MILSKNINFLKNLIEKSQKKRFHQLVEHRVQVEAAVVQRQLLPAAGSAHVREAAVNLAHVQKVPVEGGARHEADTRPAVVFLDRREKKR